MYAHLKKVRISTRKMGLAVKLVGKGKVTKVEALLHLTCKKSAQILKKVIHSAAANAIQQGEVLENLAIKEIFIGPGPTLKRFSPRARGSAYQILKRTSDIKVYLKAIDPNIKSTKKTEDLNEKVKEIAEKVEEMERNAEQVFVSDEFNPNEKTLKSSNKKNEKKSKKTDVQGEE